MALGDRFDRRGKSRAVPDIARLHLARSTRTLDLRLKRSQLLCIARKPHDMATIRCEPDRDRSTDASTRSCDNGYSLFDGGLLLCSVLEGFGAGIITSWLSDSLLASPGETTVAHQSRFSLSSESSAFADTIVPSDSVHSIICQ